MADEDFSKLLQQAEQLTTEIEGNEELPRVERSLGQVLEASQELYSRVIQSGANDIQAYVHVLLHIITQFHILATIKSHCSVFWDLIFVAFRSST